MSLPLLEEAVHPFLFLARNKTRDEPGGSTLGEGWRVTRNIYQDAHNRAQTATDPIAVLDEFAARYRERIAQRPNVAHDPTQAFMLECELDAISVVVGFLEEIGGEPAEVHYLPVPRHA